MQVTFTHDMRLNLIAIMDQQPCKTATAQAIWDLQDKLKLDKSEAEEMELRFVIVGGAKQAMWNPTKSIAPRKIDLTEQEVSLIGIALEGLDARPAWRPWLQPLMAVVTLEPEQPRPVAVPKRR